MHSYCDRWCDKHACLKNNYTIRLTTDDQDSDDFKYGSKVVISLDRLPNERLKRNVVRSRMDLIGK